MAARLGGWWRRGEKSEPDEQQLLARIKPERLPRHIAIIMDGNGRWARARGLPRLAGHRVGVESLKEIVRTCGELGIAVLTVYAFSTENWKRPSEEVNGLMDLLVEYVQKELAELHQQGVKVRTIGDISRLPVSAQAELNRAKEQTKNNQGLVLNIALNYGGRLEILDAVHQIAYRVKMGELAIDDIDEAFFASQLDTAGLPDPDLLIRTSGEMRVSNFMLWQIAYTEIWVSPVMWPDFRKHHLLQAIIDYQERDRRYGGINA
ncbi:MAG: isoprenyl transferase [Firmicutes bacterium]|nr:isoprenyl transferase [Bacillota bacterium]